MRNPKYIFSMSLERISKSRKRVSKSWERVMQLVGFKVVGTSY